MRMWLKTHAGECEITHERKPSMELERFKLICFVVYFVVWCAVVCVITMLDAFWFLVWFLCATAVLVGMWILSHGGVSIRFALLLCADSWELRRDWRSREC